MDHDHLFIGGRWATPHSGARITVISPVSEEPIGSVPFGDRADVDAAVRAARTAFDDPDGWAGWEPSRRAVALVRFADELERRGGEIGRSVSVQNGMPAIFSGPVEGVVPAQLLRYYAAMIDRDGTERSQRRLDGTGDTLVHRAPLGVVGAIIPWNFPQALAAFKYAAALAAGCTVVLKPSPETVFDAYLLAEAAAGAGLPAGVFNIVAGGPDTGAALVEHPGVDKIGFTGSTAVGRHIAEVCGRLLRPVTLELGGKSAGIIVDDVDLDTLVSDGSLFGRTLVNSGQTCWLSTRILAPRNRYDEVVDALVTMVRSLPVGDPLDPATRIGPLVSERQLARVLGYIDKGRREGARLVAGGGRPRPRGWFVDPTVFADVDNRSTIGREEIFGPVLSVIPYDGLDDAVRIADDSEYGLSGTVWARDVQQGIDLAKRIRTGSFSVNGAGTDLGAPLGGVKSSGLGRELSVDGLHSYQYIQSIYARH